MTTSQNQKPQPPKPQPVPDLYFPVYEDIWARNGDR